MADTLLQIKQGATFRLTLKYEDAAGNPIDITGWKVRMQARKSQSAPALIDATTETGEFTIDGPAGLIYLRLKPSQTNVVTSKSLLYDIELETDDEDPDVYRILEGEIEIDPNITQTAPEVVVT